MGVPSSREGPFPTPVHIGPSTRLPCRRTNKLPFKSSFIPFSVVAHRPADGSPTPARDPRTGGTVTGPTFGVEGSRTPEERCPCDPSPLGPLDDPDYLVFCRKSPPRPPGVPGVIGQGSRRGPGSLGTPTFVCHLSPRAPPVRPYPGVVGRRETPDPFPKSTTSKDRVTGTSSSGSGNRRGDQDGTSE